MQKNKKTKKQKLNYSNKIYDHNTEAWRIIKILLGIILFLVFFYLLAMIMTGEIKFGKKEKIEEETVIQYDEILAGQSLNRMDEEYYVLYYDFSEKIASTYVTYRDTYTQALKGIPMYMVDLENGFNTGYVLKEGEERVELPEEINQLKVLNPTILKIKDHKVIERTEGKEAVKNLLKELNK